jgi:PAS domain S-box-containing protein
VNVSDDMHRRVLLAVPEGIWVVDPEGRTIFSNRRMAEILGTDFAAMSEQSCFDCVFPDELADAQRHFQRAISGDRRPFDFRLRRGDGSPVWVSISCMTLSDDGGAPFGLLGLFSDITERKQAEAALRESEERFRAIFDLAAVGVVQVSLTGDLQLVNNQFCEIVGYTREELIGRNIQEISHPGDLEEVKENTRRLVAGEIPYFSMEKRYIRKGGEVIWTKLHKSCVRDLDGHPRHSIVVLEDITEARNAQAALKESEARFRNMADSAPVQICLFDTGLNVIFCNRQLQTFMGRSEEQLRPESFKRTVHPDDYQKVRSTVLGAVQARRVFEVETRMLRADGEYRSMFTTGTPRFAAGKFVGYITITVDITELKRKQDYVLATQKLESLGVLAGGIAHDFNNLLGGILTSTELISAASAEGSPPDEEALDRIRTAAIRGGEIVRQLMIYTGEETQAFSPVDLPQLVSEMLQLLKVSISKRATLKVDFPPGLPPVRANAAQLRQVVLNLITNASEALQENEGTISVSAAQISSRRDQATSPAQRDYIRLDVADTGCGMTEEVQAKIFDPFFTSKFAGRGLGLASVRGIVRSHGGVIHVVSAPGQGSRFEILLPCCSESSHDRQTPAARSFAESADCPHTVLLVEDEELLRQAAAKMLRMKGFAVIEAADGKTAVSVFRERASAIDVVLLDLNLPGISGKEVFSELKRIRSSVKVILTSAYSREWARSHVGDNGPWPYIRKPYQLSDLTSLLRSVCAADSSATGGAAGAHR